MKFISFTTQVGAKNSPNLVYTCTADPFCMIDLHTGMGLNIRDMYTNELKHSLPIRQDVMMPDRHEDHTKMKKFIQDHARPGDRIDVFYNDGEKDHFSVLMLCLGDNQ